MKKLKSILLLFLMGVVLFPWGLICIVHPLGHKHHHEPGELSPCEIRKQYKGNEQAFFPPMHCKSVSATTDNYHLIEKYQVKISLQKLIFLAVVEKLEKVIEPKHTFLLQPEPRCRSATIISSNSLRGPPLI